MAKAPAKLNKPLNNRIIGSGTERVDQMLANPLNFRIHPDNQQQALAGAIDDIGFIRSVTVNKRTGRVIDGHLRVTLAARSGVEEIPVEYVDLDEAEEAQALLSLDPIAAMAASDKQKLDELLHQVQSDDERVQEMMAEIGAREGLYQDENAGRDAEPQINKADELREKWQTELGQLWKLGEHRLICGDCTDRAVVDRLMQGEKADMVFTDPPYGVDYDGGSGNKNKREKLAGDETGDLYSPSLLIYKSICIIGAPMYIWFADRGGKPVYDAVYAIGYKIRAMIVWNKLDAHYGAFMAQYMQKHEPCLYIVNGNANWIGENNEVTVWDVKQPSVNDYHPTQKPIELAERAIGNHKADIVADFFLGSGTTLIACENLHRKCRAIEISPAYVAVALQRWADLTGKMPELLT